MNMLANSNIPMFIIHDLQLKVYNSCKQIDFLVITQKLLIIIESKNYNCDISIDCEGNFHRIIPKNDKNHISLLEIEGKFHDINNKIKKKRISSPVTQVNSQITLVMEVLASMKPWYMFEKRYIKRCYRRFMGIVAFTNPEREVSLAKSLPRNLAVNADKLIISLKAKNSTDIPSMSLKKMKKIADYLISQNCEPRIDFKEAY